MPGGCWSRLGGYYFKMTSIILNYYYIIAHVVVEGVRLLLGGEIGGRGGPKSEMTMLIQRRSTNHFTRKCLVSSHNTNKSRGSPEVQHLKHITELQRQGQFAEIMTMAEGALAITHLFLSFTSYYFVRRDVMLKSSVERRQTCCRNGIKPQKRPMTVCARMRRQGDTEQNIEA